MFGRIVKITIIVIVIIAIWFVDGLFRPNSPNDARVEFAIAKGQGVNEISNNLDEAGVLRSKLIFETYLWLKDVEGNLIADDYRLAQNLNVIELAEILTTPQATNNEVEVTLIEGWSNNQIANALAEAGLIDVDKFLDDVGHSGVDYALDRRFPSPENYSRDFDFLKDKPKNRGVEGYLFPDTYRFFANATQDDVVEKLLGNFDAKFTEQMRADIKSQGKSVYEIIIMASILEKEVRGLEEKKQAADVFYKRLELGQALQADSTVNYAVGKSEFFTTASDREFDSLYNTYKYPGLPPGPISNPSIDSITAAIYPTANDYYYFLTDQDGVVHFAPDYDAHLNNVNTYLRN